MSSAEQHATRAEDWRVYGHNLAAECHYMGGQFPDARRLMLDAWDAWASGEPPREELLYELFATIWAMAMSTGIDGFEKPLEAFAAALEVAS